MNNYYKYLFYLTVFAVVFSCSTRKNKFLNRNFHATTSKYNILFNGEESFKKGIATINEKYEDDYWLQLPIEPLKFEEEILNRSGNLGSGFGIEEESKASTPFDKAEEKAVKAIQKHTMNIGGRERNRQIDDAYLLLGKSRYYSQRFIPAIEAFNYVIANYPYASLINETKIWRAKANIRLDNEEFAIESLKLLLRTDGIDVLPFEIEEQAHTALAMAYIKLDSTQHAIEHLKKATTTEYNKEQTARNLFVLGQLYSLENKKDSAIQVFSDLIYYKKAPYKYRVHANIELAKNNPKDSSSFALIAHLQKMIKNRDNRPYLDNLYYEVGVLEEGNDSISKAVFNYNKSIQAKNGSDKQKTFTYERLGNLNFKQSNYILASAYYDSVLQVAANTKDSIDIRIRRVKRKYKSLASLIEFENVVQTNDSIIRIASMSEGDQKLFFETYIAKIKKEDEEKTQQQLNAISFGNSFGGNAIKGKNKGKWYFYNSQSSEFGEVEFKKIWGNRALEDNWRWSSVKNASAIVNKDSVTTNSVPKQYQLASYLEGIPKDVQKIDSLKAERNEALFELGLIYKEQFKNSQTAILRLERLLSLNKEEHLKLSAHYYLYQIYKDLKDTEKEEFHRNIVLTNYPQTSFAEIIKFPNKKLVEEKLVDKTVDLYEGFYSLYKEEAYEEIRIQFDINLPAIEKSVLISKFELLKAYAVGKYKSQKAFRLAMEYVAFVYAETEEGKEATTVVARLKTE